MQSQSFFKRHPVAELLGEFAIAGLLSLFLYHWLVWPLRVLIVFFHELAHALAAWMTGGHVHEFAVNIHEGGHVIASGGWHFFIATAGYLGSLLIGVFLFLVARHTNLDRVFSGLLGASLVLIGIIYGDSFLLTYSLIFGGILLVAAIWLPNIISDIFLRIIGLTSMLFVPRDIISDTLMRPEIQSDARIIAEQYGGTVWFWGGLWLVISFVIIILVIWHQLHSLRHDQVPEIQGSQP